MTDQSEELGAAGFSRAGFNVKPNRGPTASDVEDIHQLARDEGYQTGYQEGYDEGFQKITTEIKKKSDAELAKFAQMTRNIMKPIEDQKVKIVQGMYEIIAELTQQIIHQEIKVDKKILFDLIEQTFDDLDVGSNKLSLSVSEADFEYIESAVKAHVDYDSSWRIKKHARLTEGAVLVETENNQVEINMNNMTQDTLKNFYSNITGANS